MSEMKLVRQSQFTKRQVENIREGIEDGNFLDTLINLSKSKGYDLSDKMKKLLSKIIPICSDVDRFTYRGPDGWADFLHILRNKLVNEYLHYSQEKSALDAVKTLEDQLDTLLTEKGFVRIQISEYKVAENFDISNLTDNNFIEIIQQMDKLDQQYIKQLLKQTERKG